MRIVWYKPLNKVFKNSFLSLVVGTAAKFGDMLMSEVEAFVTFERSKVTKNLLLSKPYFHVRLLNRRHPCRRRVAT